uniref:Serine/threonine-protein phosphatase 4 regulatory subunit 2 n=1 Tax=Microcebus murinus TaxID=30608 RepID=A0A8C5W6F0_MICMU
MAIERLQEAPKDFEKRGKKEVCPVLDQILCHVAKTEETMIQWSQFKGYFIFKLEKVMDDFRTSAPEPRGPPSPNVEYIPFGEMKERILKIVTAFKGIPLTIQRLCELLADPRRNYTGTDRLLRGVEKHVTVVSCVYPSSEKNNSNSLNRMNGVIFPGKSPSYPERSDTNGPGTPRPLNRPKVSLSAPLTTNGLPENTDNKESNSQPNEEKNHKVSSVSPGPEVKKKRLRFDKEGKQLTAREISSVVVEETETSSASQDKDTESSGSRQHCDASAAREETSEENNEMEESRAEKDLLHSEGSENTGPVGSRPNSSQTGEILSESSSGNDDEATEVTDEPMEQDYLETFRCSVLHTVLVLTL